MVKEPVITVKNLNHYFGKGGLRRQILYNINLELQPGEIAIMSGPSGSGKTTLLTLIGCLRSVQEGSLKVLGQEVFGASDTQLMNIRRHIGYIFQSHNLLNFLTARQNVQMSVELHEEFSPEQAISKSEAVIESVGLEKWSNNYPEELSGGQKQRVAIARALVCHPKLVLADEPTAALDGKSGRNIMELIQKLVKEQGCSVLMVTHDNRVLDIADRIIYMEDGQLNSESA
jgi:putative ABC transport system ATP-binding protein